MIDINKIEIICNEALKENEFLVDAKINGNNDIVIALDSFDGINIFRCAEISRYIESKLDRDKEDFSLEVGSPGLNSPFKVIQQYQKNVGKNVAVTKTDGLKYQGKLLKVNDMYIILSLQNENNKSKEKKSSDEEVKICFSDIKSTKIVISLK